MVYTAHAGPREAEWPNKIGEARTRHQAQEIVVGYLASVPWDSDVTKGEVRLREQLMDCYTRKTTGTIRHIFAVNQRQREEA